MKHIYPQTLCVAFCFFFSWTSYTQCPVSVDAGEDIYLCDLDPDRQLEVHGQVSGDYYDFIWSPANLFYNPKWFSSLVYINKTSTLVLSARSTYINLLVNPDFEQGNVGFSTTLDYSPGNLVPQNTYDLLPNPQTANDTLSACNDHTSGTGNMMAANLRHEIYNTPHYIWCQTVEVEPHTDYYWHFWGTRLDSSSNVTIIVKINDFFQRALVLNPNPVCEWDSLRSIWNSGANISAEYCLTTTKPAATVAIDDLFFGPICTVRDSMQIIVSPPVANAQPSLYSIPCAGNEVTLNGNGSSVGPQFTYQWTTNNGNIVSGAQTLTPVVNAGGLYTLTVSLPTGLGECEKTTSVEVLETNNLSAWINAPSNLNCSGQTVLLGGTNMPGQVLYEWTAPPDYDILLGQHTPKVTINAPGLYTLAVTNTSTGCTAEASVQVEPALVPSVAVLPPDTLQGAGHTVQIIANATPANATYTWTTAGGIIVSGSNTASPTVSAPGIYTVVVTHPASGCTSSASVQVHSLSPCANGANAGPDWFACLPDLPVQLTGSIGGHYHDVQWSPSQYLSDSNTLAPTASVAQTTAFVLTARMYSPTQNLLPNGDFETGNTGFSSDLQNSPDDLSQPGSYSVLPDPFAADPTLPPCSGTGNMLAARLAPLPGHQNIWCRTVAVQPGIEYRLSARAMRLAGTGTLDFRVNNNSVGTLPLPADSCQWIDFTRVWPSTGTSANVCAGTSDTNGALALDDLLFVPLCTARDTMTIEVAEEPTTAVIAAPDPLTCATSTVDLNAASSATGPGFTYQWSTSDGNLLSGANTLAPTVDAPGVYDLLVVNTSNGCTATESVAVVQDIAAPEIAVAPTDPLTCVLPSQTLPAQNDAPAGTFVYQWTTSDGNILAGANALQPEIDAPGTYSLLATNLDNGCTAIESVTVTQDIAAPEIAVSPAELLTCVLSSQNLLAQNTTPDGTFIYDWTTADGNILGGQNTLQPEIDAPGTYALLATNIDNGCTATETVVVAQDLAAPEIVLGQPEVFNCLVSEQLLPAQNTAPVGTFSYQWTTADGNILGGQNTLQPEIDAPGTYALLATNIDNGCTATETVVVAQDLAAPEIVLGQPEVFNCLVSEQLLPAQNTAPVGTFSYQWTTADGNIRDGQNTLQPEIDAPGIYFLLATNLDNGCTATAEVTAIGFPDVEAVFASQGDATCFGATDGTATVLATGGTGQYTYAWENGEQTATAAQLPAGTYAVTVADEQGCTAVLFAQIGQPDAVVPNATSTAPTFLGGGDGTASANPDGGTPGYAFVWSTGQTTQTILDLPAGTYTVTVIDANGCTAEQTVTVFGGACNVDATATGSDPACHGTPTGTATAQPLGGTAPFTFLWSNGATAQTVTGLEAEAYSVVVTDANGCTVAATVVLDEPPLLTLQPGNVTDASCPDTPDGSATVLPDGGTGDIAVTWNGGQQGPTATGLGAGTHTATATDQNGCTTVLSLIVNAMDTEPPVIQGGPVTLPLGPAGVISLTLQNLAVTATDNCAVEVDFFPGSFDCLQLGTHPVNIVAYDAAGNSSSLTIQVTVIDNLPPSVECPADVRRCADDRTVEYLAPVATDNCLMLGGHFDLVEGLPSGSQFPVGTTVTTYTFTDASGNVGSCSFTALVLSPIAVALNGIQHDVGGQGVGGVQVSVSGSLPGYVFEWKNAEGQTVTTTEDLVGVGAGAYTLLVTDSYGCTSVAGPFVVDNLVGTHAPNWADLVAVYPNPTTGAITVVLPDAAVGPDVRFAVFDATGRLVLEQNAAGHKQAALDWSGLADGTYALLIRTNTGQAAYRIVLRK